MAVVAGLGASVTGSSLVRRKGRERVGTGGVADAAWAGTGGGPSSEVLLDQEELAAMATTEFAPPEGITAPMGGIILTEAVRPEHKVAWLLEAAIAGDVELIEEDKKAVRLVRKSPGHPETQGILDMIFVGRDRDRAGLLRPHLRRRVEHARRTARSVAAGRAACGTPPVTVARSPSACSAGWLRSSG